MKILKRFLALALILTGTFLLNNQRCLAAEAQYTENVIPVMTSNTSPSGKASASSTWSVETVYHAYRAFDHGTVDGWCANTVKGWVEYEFTEAKCVTKYTLSPRSRYSKDLESMPKKWTFEGWNDNLNEWIVLDTQENITNWVTSEKKEFLFSNSAFYNKYRINVVENCGNSFTVIGELEMMETVTGPAINTLKVVLEVNEEFQLSVDDDLDENIKMTWTSSDNSVATVDASGNVTALAPGNTMITVISEDGTYTDYINVLVVDDADDYRLAVDLKVGKSCRLTVDDLTDTVKATWSSMDSSVATVNSKGKVTAVNKGLTIITATDEEGNEIGQIYVRVRE